MTVLAQLSLDEYLAAVAARKSTPGGGAVAGIVAAEACALMSMVIAFTRPPLNDMQERVNDARRALLSLADEDALAFELVMQAYKSGGDRKAALQGAAEVPLKIIGICGALIDDLEQLAGAGNSNLMTDVGIAAALIAGSLASSELNVLVNAKEMDTESAATLRQSLEVVPGYQSKVRDILQRIKTGL